MKVIKETPRTNGDESHWDLLRLVEDDDSSIG